MSDPIGFIGLGQMGFAIAQNLLQSGYPLRVFNRTPDKAKPLADRGALVAKTPGDVVGAGGIVVTMLSDDQAVKQIVLGEHGIVDRLGRDGIHLAMTTISPDTARELSEHHAKRGSHYLAAPVFGRPDAAAARKIWICLSGNPAAKERVQDLLGTLGQGIYDFGEDPGAANVAKLAGNFLIAAVTEALAEAYTLAEKNGLERAQMHALVSQTLWASPVYQNYGRMIAHEQYRPAGFRMALGLKDISLVLQTAKSSLTPMPLADLCHERLLASLAKGRDELDWAGFALEVSEDAGLRRNI